MAENPEILVIAGPNGSGKSTITDNLPIKGIYINADDISLMTGMSNLEAAIMAEKEREALLAAGMDFTFETVLSKERNLKLLKRAKDKGYIITGVFVLTHDVTLNLKRVKERAAAGGHDVPPEKILSRYYDSLGNISELMRICDYLRIVDTTGGQAKLICETDHGRILLHETAEWDRIDILALLASK